VTWTFVTALQLDSTESWNFFKLQKLKEKDPATFNYSAEIEAKSHKLQKALKTQFAKLFKASTVDVGVGALTLYCPGLQIAATPWTQCPQDFPVLFFGVVSALCLLVIAIVSGIVLRMKKKHLLCFRGVGPEGGIVATSWDMYGGEPGEEQRRMLGERAVTYTEMYEAMNQGQDQVQDQDQDHDREKAMSLDELRKHWLSLPAVPLVGDRLQALPGKSFVKKGVEVYGEGDFAIVESYFVHTDGTYKMRLAWERSGQSSNSHVTSWQTKYRFAPAVLAASAGSEAESVCPADDVAAPPFNVGGSFDDADARMRSKEAEPSPESFEFGD